MKKTDTTEWAKLHARMRTLAARKAKAKAGLLATAGVNPESGTPLVVIGTVHELGSPAQNIPQRSFIGRTLDLRETELRKLLHDTAVAYVEGHVELATALDTIGKWLADAIKETILTEQVVPRLEESAAGRRTIERKGSSVTLVDQRYLVNAIDHEVVVPPLAGEGK